MIFNDENVQGRSSFLGVNMDNDDLGTGMSDNFYDTQTPPAEFDTCSQQKKRKCGNSNSSRTRKVVRTVKEIHETLEEKPGLTNRCAGEEGGEEGYCSIERIVAALETVPDMSDEVFLEACELLEDERKAKMFVAMDVAARRQWLLSKLGR